MVQIQVGHSCGRSPNPLKLNLDNQQTLDKLGDNTPTCFTLSFAGEKCRLGIIQIYAHFLDAICIYKTSYSKSIHFLSPGLLNNKINN